MSHEITLNTAESLEQIEVVIDKNGWREEGLVKLKDGWLIVHGALASERVLVRVEPRRHPRDRRLYAQVLEVIEPSSERHPAACHKFFKCQGCQTRMISWEKENKAKEQKVEEILEKFAGVVVNCQTIALDNHARRGVRMRGNLVHDGERLGLRSFSKIQSMSDCAALTPKAIQVVNYFEAQLLRDERLEFMAPKYGPSLATIHISEIDDNRLKRFEENSIGTGLSIIKDGEEVVQFGPTQTTIDFAGSRLLATRHSWVPASEEASAPLYAWIRERCPSGQVAVDLGCAIGGVSAQIATNFQTVFGIDQDRHAIEIYKENLKSFNAHAIAGKFENGLRKLVEMGVEPDWMSINPMREPLGEAVIRWIKHLKPNNLLYLAPSPTSGAKDLVQLLDTWTLQDVWQANVHPHSHHTMMVVSLVTA